MNNLQVVWPKTWVADEFAKAGIDVTHHYGIDVVKQTGPIWWATEHAARSMAAGNGVQLTAPNWYDFLSLPRPLLKRKVWASTVGAGSGMHGLETFVKIADSKCIGPGDTGKAMVADVVDWCQDCLDFGVPGNTRILLSDPVEWIAEWRVWTDGENLLEMSMYQEDGKTWDEWPQEDPPGYMVDFACKAIKWVEQPCTIDVGQIGSSGDPAVVELNPAWSSGFYTSDMAKVYQAIKASCGGRGGREWEPDVWLRKQFPMTVDNNQ